jgi:hypothetical protein
MRAFSSSLSVIGSVGFLDMVTTSADLYARRGDFVSVDA